MALTDLRRNYTLDSLTESDLTPNPLDLFDNWLQQVIEGDIPDPNAMTLATVDSSGHPSQRIVLLKGRPENHFVFYTNYESNKASDIAGNNNVSLHFPWYLMERQVMVLGQAFKLSEDENDAYFASRPKASQLGAVVSQQSRPLASKATLVTSLEQLSEQYREADIPRPKLWGGFYVVPHTIEFWQGGEHRLHDRFRYTTEDGNNWQVQRLNP
ncbi:pyridoxamine 5'-phosphate oxidase [Alteromonas sediminis]|uniref:Pyridoxine/pyridoxamine 5'-phosphate oxidase n=1 Tax=Alteromonas sediminis TaxID=2259342 RepID=A0A3N5Z914_9ALTE|nr:pyridoxamine 5'-phosphate oxidase [Alteromonas sediminis]RPJ65598.1 pyridoxamine 5'-phosphate oxidase [Alteromonas sediminis]